MLEKDAFALKAPDSLYKYIHAYKHIVCVYIIIYVYVSGKMISLSLRNT